MRVIEFNDVVKAVRDIIVHCGTDLPRDAYDALKQAMEDEKSPVSKEVFKTNFRKCRYSKK